MGAAVGNPVPLRYVALRCVAVPVLVPFCCLALPVPVPSLTFCTPSSATHTPAHTPVHTHAREMLINLLIVRRCFPPATLPHSSHSSHSSVALFRFVCACGDFMFYLAFTLPNCCFCPRNSSLPAPFDCSSCYNVLVTPWHTMRAFQLSANARNRLQLFQFVV